MQNIKIQNIQTIFILITYLIYSLLNADEQQIIQQMFIADNQLSLERYFKHFVNNRYLLHFLLCIFLTLRIQQKRLYGGMRGLFKTLRHFCLNCPDNLQTLFWQTSTESHWYWWSNLPPLAQVGQYTQRTLLQPNVLQLSPT